MRWAKSGVAGVAALTLVAVSACSSGSGGGSKSSATASVSGDPVKVMVITRIASANGSFPGVPKITKVLQDQVNAGGGINGHPLSVEVCDDHATGDDAETCARKAVTDGVVTVLGSYSTNMDRVFPIIDKTGIVAFSNYLLDPISAKDPGSYPTSGNTYVNYANMSTALLNQGKTRVVMGALDIPAGLAPVPYAQASLALQGHPMVDVVRIPASATDMTSYAVKAASEGDAIILALANSAMGSFAAGLTQSGKKAILAHSNSAITQKLVDSTGGANGPLEGSIIGNYYLPTDNPLMRPYNDLVAASKVTPDGPTLQAWLAITLFKQIAKRIDGPVTASTFKKDLDSLNDFSTGGLTPPLSYTTEFNVPGLNRLFIRSSTYSIVKDGKIVDSGKGYIDATAALRAAKASS